jgi:hypothetical protein
MPVLTGWELNRQFIYCLLYCANEGLSISNFTNSSPPLSDDEKLSLIRGVSFEIDLDQALTLTANALKDASGSLAAAHDAAAAVTVDAPTSIEYDALEVDLEKLSLYVKRDQTAKALSGFLADAANSISALNKA